MTKMNRRRCLIGMGAAAGVFAVGNLDLLALKKLELADPARSMVEDEVFVTSGPNIYDLLPTQSVKLVFHGLLGFYLNALQNECLVGFHSKPTLKHKHRLTVMAFTNCQPQWDEEKEVPTNANPVLEVKEPNLISGVKFYQPPSASLHDSDFRHVIDLEGPSWYRGQLQRKPGVYKPVMSINNGLFYTLLKTKSTFKKQTQGASPTSVGDHIGSIASYVAVNIYLKPGGTVSLKIPEAGIDLLCAYMPNTKYEIHFNNGCFKRLLNKGCQFKPNDSDETERNDFYMHRDAVELGTGVKYQLVREPGPPSPPTPDICQTRYHPLSPEEIETTDEAPCAAVAYGSVQWPPYPEL